MKLWSITVALEKWKLLSLISQQIVIFYIPTLKQFTGQHLQITPSSVSLQACVFTPSQADLNVPFIFLCETSGPLFLALHKDEESNLVFV